MRAPPFTPVIIFSSLYVAGTLSLCHSRPSFPSRGPYRAASGTFVLGEPQGDRAPTEFQLNRGQLVDTLSNDYTYLFAAPDLILFDDSIELRVPDGKCALVGIAQYAAALELLRLSCHAAKDNVHLTHRITVDDLSVCVRWSTQLSINHPVLRLLSLSHWSTVVYADGISRYHLHAKAHVFLHEIESIILSAPHTQASPLPGLWPPCPPCCLPAC